MLSRPSLLLTAVWLLPLLTSAAADWFDAFDVNHDGFIDRSEYSDGMAKLKSVLSGAVPAASASFWSGLELSAGFWKAFSSGVAMIIATEIGDKTFFIAAVLSMRNSRSAVFGGAIVALILMTILSSAMGQILPSIIPKQYTHLLGGALFLYFGVKLILESRRMEANKVSEELDEVEEELHIHANKGDDDDEEKQNISIRNPRSKNWYQIWLQALTLTFLAEWGDRSQIATIALSAAKNPYGVTVGGCLGHSFCTGLAVMGGRMLAARISEKTVSLWGGIVFLVFGLHSIFLES